MGSMHTSIVPLTYSVGVHDLSSAITIPRKRTNMVGVPGPWDASHPTAKALPAGILYGQDMEGTVLRFATSVTTAMITTEGYGASSTGDSWNEDNQAGDTNLRYNLCARIQDLTIDGKGQFHSYPYSQVGTPDLHGPDIVWRADGIQAESTFFSAHRVKLYQIPGVAMRVKQPVASLAAGYSIYDIPGMCELDHIYFGQVQYGIIVEHGDAKLTRIFGGGIAKDGVVFSSAGGYITDSHVAGADRALVFTIGAQGRDLYMEAARIGTNFIGGSDGSYVDGLNIGPGTCWYRGAKIEAGSITVLNITGKVMPTSVTYTDIAGIELITNAARCNVQGNLEITTAGTPTTNTGACGVLLNGTQNEVDLICGWNTSASSAAAVRVIQSITRCEVKARGTIVGGCALDLSATNLNSVNGLGNVFDIKYATSGGGVPVRYPGGGTTYNLTSGNKVYIDGTLQS